MEKPKALTQMGLGAWNLKKHTDKQEKKIFLIYREIQSGAVPKSYMRKGNNAANISPYMRSPLVTLSKRWTSFYPVYDVYERCIFE